MKKTYSAATYDKLKLCLLLFALSIIILPLSGCRSGKEPEPIVVDDQNSATVSVPSITAPVKRTEITITPAAEAASPSVLNSSGSTMETRINAPAGYTRIPSVKDELAGYLRTLKLKKDGSKVLLYDGKPAADQDGHAAVFDMDIGEKDLQQCADSIIRIYAEYYWSKEEYDWIAFHLTNGFLMEYTKWREGYRISVSGNDVSWVKKAGYDDSYRTFRAYLDTVFTYAGTLSLASECTKIEPSDMLPGDMFLSGGSPGHCVLVVDAAVDKNGNKCYLLAQGYMPAQDFHILKNPLHPEDPWYYFSEITYPLRTPGWTFKSGSLVRWCKFALNNAGTPINISETGNMQEHLTAVPAMSKDIKNANEAKEDSSSVHLLAVGDNLIHVQVVKSGKKANGTYNYDHLYSNLSEEISAADIAVINQETIFGGNDFAYSGYPNFNSPTEIGDAVIKAGFDVVLQATNHAMDMGVKGIKNDLNYWSLHPKIKVLGINETEKDYNKINIIEKNGIKIAMLNYTYGLNGYTLPKDMPYLVDLLDRKKMTEDIKKAEAQADFTIVFPHWGTEYVYQNTAQQTELTNFFYKQGVDLVIGTHPHVLEPVKWIKNNPDHKMLVYYSLGNFISYQREAPRMLGGMADVTITKDRKGTYISDASIIPIITHYENSSKDYHYEIYKLKDYNDALAKLHGVSKFAEDGPLTYRGILTLAKQILGSWYQP